MKLKTLFALSLTCVNLFALNLSGNYSFLNENTVSFELKEKMNKNQISKITHKIPFKCSPNLDGVVEYSEKELIFYTKNLHKGLNYICELNGVFYEFKSKDFELNFVDKIDKNSYLLSFNDSVNLENLKQNLKVGNLEFDLKELNPKKFVLNLKDEKKDNRIFISKNLSSEFNATLVKDWEEESKKSAEKNLQIDEKLKTYILKSPEFVSLKNGKFALRIKNDSYFSETSELKKFIKIKGIENFTISDVLYLSDLDDYKYDENSADYYYIDIISDEFKPQTEYEISFLRGFSDYYKVVRKEQNFNLKTGDFAPFVDFVSDKPYISSLGEIGIKSTNLSSIKVVVEKLADQNFRYFLNYDSQNLKDQVSEVGFKIYELNGTKNEINDHKIKLDLNKANDGVYLITIYYDKDKSISKIVYLSDIAISAKVSRDQIFVFANRLSQNLMLGGANVKIYDTKNQELATGATNDEGVFIFNKKDIYKNAKSVVVSIGNEQNFLIINDEERLNQGAYYLENSPKDNFLAYVYFASGLIRPNEEIKASIYLRNAEFKPLKEMPVKLVIRNPLGKQIREISKNTNEFGVISLNEVINSDLTGRFGLEVIYADKILQTSDFFVESFTPARIKNEILLEKDEFLNSELLFANLSANYLFGSPASNFEAEVELYLSDKTYKDERYKNYSFKNSNLENINSKNLFKKIKLDNEGKAKTAFDLTIDNGVLSVLSGNLRFSINDDGNVISKSKEFTIYPYKNLVGVVASKDFLERGEKVKIKSVLLDSLSKKELNGNIKFEIRLENWNYTTSYNNRNYGIKWFKELVLIDEFLKENGEFEYSFAKSGNYTIIAKDIQSGASASYEIRVSGYENSTLTPIKELSSVAIKSNANSYKKGDEISLDISSAIKEGLGLITFEAGDVKSYKLINIKNHSANVKFKVDFDFFGGYISAFVYRIADSEKKPFRTNGKVYVAAKSDDKKINIDINSTNAAKTNELVKIELKTAPNSDISLFVVDLGVLDIISQKSPNPLEFFYKKLDDEVYEYDIYSKLSGFKIGGKSLNFGGGFMAEAMSKHESPVDSKNIETFVKMARLKSDENGKAYYEFKTDNGFNSSIRIDAIVTNEGSFGTASKKVVVKDDIIIKPTLLLYMLKGDEINARLRLVNSTNLEQNLNLNLSTTKNLEALVDSKKINLKPLENRNLSLKLKALDLSKAELNISVKNGKDKFINLSKFDIINPYPVSTYAKSLKLSKKESFKLESGLKSVSISASKSIKTLLENVSNNLIEYPYGCAEQRSSRLLALLYAKPNDENLLLDRERFIKNGIKDLVKMQKNNGFFGYWDQFSYVNNFASVYATDVLLELDKNSFNIDKSVKKSAINSLKEILNSKNAKYFEQMYAAFVLSKYNKLDSSTLNRIYDSKIYYDDLLGTYMMIAMLKNSSYDNEAKNLSKKVEVFEKGKKRDENFVELLKESIFSSEINELIKQMGNIGIDKKRWEIFGSNLRNEAFLLYIHSLILKPNEFSDNLAKKLLQNINKTYSTQERAFMIRAISSYFKDLDDNGAVKVTYDGNEFDLQNGETITISPKNAEFTIEPSGKNVFLNLSSSGYKELKEKHGIEKKELDVFRTFLDRNAKQISPKDLKVGDIFYSKVELRANSSIDVLVVNEIISPCFEIIDENFSGFKRDEKLKNNSEFLEYQTIKDDRIVSFAKLNSRGTLNIFTPFRVVLSGKCKIPAVIAENMYDESQNDYDLEIKEVIVGEGE